MAPGIHFKYGVPIEMSATDSDEIKITLDNIYDYMYLGPAIVGSGSDTGSVVYDTGSGELTITSTNCSSCYSNVYDYD